MTKQCDRTKLSGLKPGGAEKGNLRGYPAYPAGEDLYNQFREEQDIDPENIALVKKTNQPDESGLNTGKVITGSFSGIDLDVPGSELDDAQEEIGAEHEENNFYSLGGDEHSN